MTIKEGTMKRDELYAKYMGVMNINAVLKQQNSELLEALKGLLEMIANPIADPNRVETVKKAQQAIAKTEGKT